MAVIWCLVTIIFGDAAKIRSSKLAKKTINSRGLGKFLNEDFGQKRISKWMEVVLFVRI